MPNLDFLPRADADFAVWLQNFTLKVTTVYNTTFGLTAGQITAIQNDNTMTQYLITQYLEAFKSALKTRAEYKALIVDGKIGATGGAVPSATVAVPAAPANVVAPGVKARVRILAKQIKANGNYTAAIGADLGIVAPAGSGDNSGAKPKAAAAAKNGSQVVITWTKGGFDGVVIEGQRGAETGFTTLDRDFVSPYTDTRPPLVAGAAEIRKYRLFYLKKDVVVGVASDVLTVSTTP